MSSTTPPRIFIDGQAGTTGLQIADRLARRDDLELLTIGAAERKDPAARAALMAQSAVTVLCLPDAAVPEAVALADGRCRVLDASSVHRTARDWTYGLPELGSAQRRAIAEATLVSNPGCYPQGPILMLRPLIDAGWLSAAAPRTVHAVSGYSGGGRAMIERYEAGCAAHAEGLAVRSYALDLEHKHVPELRAYAGLDLAPLFAPAVGNYYQGMLCHVPLFRTELGGRAATDVAALLAERYASEPFVAVIDCARHDPREGGYLDPRACNGTNRIELMVFGSDEHLLLVARYDNLGKGAAGSAVQNLNLMLGLPEGTGLASRAN